MNIRGFMSISMECACVRRFLTKVRESKGNEELMDRHVNYTLVGLFVLIGTLGAFAFIGWYFGSFDDRSVNRYTIEFANSVNGLSVGGNVSYKGVEVGKIIDIRFEKSRPDTIMVDIEVDHQTPVTQTTDARLKPKGITGVAFIELVTDNMNAPPVKRKAGQKYPTIQASSSALDRLFDDVPEITKNILKISQRLEKVLANDNIDRSVENVAVVSENMAQATENLQELRNRVDSIAEKFDRTGTSAEASAAELEELLARIDELLARNERSIDHFLEKDLRSFSELMKNGQDAAESMTDLTDELKEEPSSLLYRKQDRGVELPK
ncbi:MAG: MlaD family protein [Pseudobdellovibrionaceae bacterium]